MRELFSGLFSLLSSLRAIIADGAALILLVFAGVFLTVKFRFFQFAHLKLWLSRTLGSIIKREGVRCHDSATVSQWGALCTALGATVGVGNIAGVASAIISGGPGAIFWMWVAALLGMMSAFCENVLGVFYRTRNSRGEIVGGAMYYLRDGLKHKKIGAALGTAFALFCALASFGIGNAGQVQAVVVNVGEVINAENSQIAALVIGVLLSLCVGAVIIGGARRASALAEKVVPAMVLLYSLCAVLVILANRERLAAVFGSIFRHAFSLRSAGGGAVGFSVKTAITVGFRRGVFSNEAGMGSSAVINSSAQTKEPVEQGMWGMFQVFVDTIIMCTLTAVAALSSGLIDLDSGKASAAAGDALISRAWETVFGEWGSVFIGISVLFFAFSTIIGWSVLGVRAWEFLFGGENLYIYRFLFVGAIVPAAVANLEGVWLFCDIANALMIIPNLTGVLLLSPRVMKITRNYLARRRQSKIPPLVSAERQNEKIL